MNKSVIKKEKLITKTSKMFLQAAVFLMILSTVALYFYTKNLLQSEVEEGLHTTESRVVDALEHSEGEFSLPPIIDVKIVDKLSHNVLKDTIIYDPSQDEMELFRELSTYRSINNNNYKISVRNLVVESGEVLMGTVVSNIVIFMLAFLFLFYFSKSRNLRIWKPFFNNLEEMKQFSLTSNKNIQLMDSDVLEFSELKEELIHLTEKVKLDYENLKQFTENVSHELQTPLAIIQAKIENIINQTDINNTQFQQITSIQKDIQRLKQLNKRLTLLTKIENNQFVTMEQIEIKSLVDSTIENFKELSPNEFLYTSDTELMVSMDSHLAQVLCNNLISNAVRYNEDSKTIIVSLKNKVLTVSNYGLEELKFPEHLFKRFYREKNNQQSMGLGLAISKKICDLYGFQIQYVFKDHLHQFTIVFK
ncbi:HAMP domain-containing sensor histidine kinase [Formosa sp. PL04]|uniref:sensor histidine kinase n=1 Tax=Formosa sp. PL04 TaxID=3081755 RepID=UPI00298132ED|nr:HAMP domain-containing sensor histidine kinase [Formosa sp. PL04]MDW5290333.1 HAMP domain-containing sensor histidine kinase [Formosa sp. PL04]